MLKKSPYFRDGDQFAAQMHHGLIMIRALLKFSEFLNANYPN